MMMKGFVLPPAAAILVAVMLVAVLGIGGAFNNIDLGRFDFFAATLTPDPTCQPGTILFPIRQTVLCERNPESFTGVFIPERQQLGLWPVYTERIYVHCPPAGDAVREGCKLTLAAGRYQLPDGAIRDGPASIDYNYGQVIDVTLLNAGMYAEVRYTTKVLSLYDMSGGVVQRRICDSCDATCTSLYSTEIYSNLPRGEQFNLQVGDSIETVVRWQEYPQAGNYINWKGQVAQCVKVSEAIATIYSLKKYEGLLSCHFYRGAVIDSVQCCSGEKFGNAVCDTDGVWQTADTPGITTGCCSGGLCSVSKCPGEGAWDFQNWVVGQPIKKYICIESTGICEVSDIRYDIQCNPLTGKGCPFTQRCDPATWRCTDKPITRMTCTEFGLECCIEGQVASNIEPRSCEEAGKPDFVCVNGFCQDPLPVNVCNYDGTCTSNEVADCPDCQECGILCQLQAFFWLWVAGMVLAAVMLIALAFLYKPAGLLFFTNIPILIVLIVILGFAFAWLFSVQVATLAAALL